MEEVVDILVNKVYKDLNSNEELMRLVKGNIFKYKLTDSNLNVVPYILLDELDSIDVEYADNIVLKQMKWIMVEVVADNNILKNEISKKVKAYFMDKDFSQVNISNEANYMRGLNMTDKGAYKEMRLYKGIVEVNYK